MNITITPEMGALIFAIITALSGAAFAYGKFNSRVDSIESDVKDIREDLKSIASKVDQSLGMLSSINRTAIADALSVSNSPRQLSDLGKKVLNDSHIREILEPKFEQIVDMVKMRKPENSYQAQEATVDAVTSLISDEGIKDAVEEGAYLSGHTPFEVLFVGALDIRDKVLEKLEFKIADIDRHDPAKKQK